MQRSDQSPRGAGRRYLAVAQAVLVAIARGDYAPGEQLPPDRELAARAGVSRPTAREALLALELIGAVEVRHGDGAYVTGPRARVGGVDGSPLDARPRELIESRRVLEPSVAALAATRMSAETLGHLSRDLDEAAALSDDPENLPQFIRLGLRFHADLAPGCGNGLLADVVAQLVNVEMHPLWALVNQQAMSSVEARRDQITDHRAILAAIRSGDSQLAAEAMSSHLLGLDAAIFAVPQLTSPA